MISANRNNPLGLMRVENATYRLVAYFHFNNLEEFTAPSIKGLSLNQSELHWSVDDKPKIHHSSWQTFHAMVRQVKHYFPNTYRRYKGEYGGFGYCFLFEKYEEMLPINMQQYIPRDFKQAVFDYFGANKELPYLITDNCLYQHCKRTFQNEKRSERHHTMKIDLVRRLFADPSYNNFNYEGKPTGDVIRKTPDYNEVLQEELRTRALLKGGFVQWRFIKKDSYFIPLLPLLALTEPDFNGEDFQYQSYTWFFEHKQDTKFKTALHDIMIIANIDKFHEEDNEFVKMLIEYSHSKRKELGL